MKFFPVCCLFLLQIYLCVAEAKQVIIDVDAGIDDCEALVVFLNAEYRNNVKVEAIVCSYGNTEVKNCIRNVMRLLTIVGKTQIPIYAGSKNAILPGPKLTQYFGNDGFGDIHLNETLNFTSVEKDIAPTAIAKIINDNPNKITYIVLGPATNLALALRMYDDVSDNLHEIFMMAGNYKTNSPEPNVLQDPEATEIVLNMTKCHITIMPYDTCMNHPFSMNFIHDANFSNPVWSLIDKANSNHPNYYPVAKGYWIVICDFFTAQAFIIGYTSSSINRARVELNGEHRGSITFNKTDTDREITVIEGYDLKAFAEDYIYEYDNICTNYKCNAIGGAKRTASFDIIAILIVSILSFLFVVEVITFEL